MTLLSLPIQIDRPLSITGTGRSCERHHSGSRLDGIPSTTSLVFKLVPSSLAVNATGYGSACA